VYRLGYTPTVANPFKFKASKAAGEHRSTTTSPFGRDLRIETRSAGLRSARKLYREVLRAEHTAGDKENATSYEPPERAAQDSKGAISWTSLVSTLKLTNSAMPKGVVMATPVPSGPVAIKMRPTRGLLWRA
jgi:hypothetical protein